MKVYTYVRIDIDTGIVVEEKSYDYNGAVALCSGSGGGSTTTVDPAYNKRMADIAERQMEMAEEYHSYWKYWENQLEQLQLGANMEMVPHQTKAGIAEANAAEAEARAREAAAESQESLQVLQHRADMFAIDASTSQSQYMADAAKAARGLIDDQTDATRSQLNLQTETNTARADLIPLQSEVAREAYNTALRGINPEQRAQEARAEMATQFGEARQGLQRDAARIGLNTSSSGMVNAMADLRRDSARGIATAMTAARNQAENQNYERLSGMAALGIGG